jgi:4'-phosphopantetheinyl transferase
MHEPPGDSGPASEDRSRPLLAIWHTGVAEYELARGHVRVWLVDLDLGLEDSELETVEPGAELAVLAADERVRAARFLRARDRRRFARCRFALRQILGGILGEDPAALRFGATGKGKPELDRGASRSADEDGGLSLRFNVSHSSELALIAVNWERELGVDIERVRQFSEAGRIVESFFSADEQTTFAAIPEEAKERAFVRGWVRKEAILKGLGVGLAGLSARYETGFGTSELVSSFTRATPAPQVEEWQLWEAAPHLNFVAALAVRCLATTSSGCA